jgi:uncharacterized membrane protein
MLIVFPLGLLATAVIFDVIALSGGTSALFNAAFWMMIAGVIGGLVSAIFGLIDWLAIPDNTRAKNIGAWHGIGNVIVTLLFAASWWLRRSSPDNPSGIALTFSFLGVALALLTAWLGGELVDRLGIGVDDGAHLNAVNSLSGLPATKQEKGGSQMKRVA